MGGRVHPNSGAGSIKRDGSTDELLIEVKDANLTHVIKAADLLLLFQQAVRVGKEPCYVVKFSNGIVVEGHIRREV